MSHLSVDEALRSEVFEPFGVYGIQGVVGPHVGREEELAALRAALERAVAFRAPQLVTVLGNQGTGKTRLVAEWLRELSLPVRVYQGRAVRGARYAAIARLLRHRFALGEGEDGHLARERVRATVEGVFDDRRVGEVLQLLGGFVGLRFGESPLLRAFEDDARKQDELARAVLRRFLELDASASPLVLWLDDLHLADDDTLALVEGLGEALAGAPIVLVVSARPELVARRSGWDADAGEAARIELRNLEPTDAARLAYQLLARCDRVPDDLIEDAVAMTGGNPFFLEELVRVFLVNGVIDARTTPWHLDAARASRVELPITVEQAIEARIAALAPDERDLLEEGATFGSVFWLSALVALRRNERAAAGEPPPAGWVDDDVAAALRGRIDGLAERDYLLVLPPEASSVPGDVEIVFKHNLERDLVAQTTDPERRRRHHRVAAQWLEMKHPERTDEQLDYIGSLHERAGDAGRAARCYRAAGDQARARYANERAVERYRRAIALFDDGDVVALMDTHHDLGSVLVLVGRADEAIACFEEMLRLAWRFDHPAKGGAAHGRIGRVHRGRGDWDRALAHLRQALALFERAGDVRGVAGALDDIGVVSWRRGAYAVALAHHERALALRRQLGDERSIALSLANLGRVHHDSGDFQQALARLTEALELRRRTGDRAGTISSLCDLGGVHEADGRLDAALAHYEEALRLAREIGDRLAQAEVLGRLGDVELARGGVEAAAEQVGQALTLAASLGDRPGEVICARRLAAIELVRGRLEEARAQARRAVQLAARLGSRIQLAIARRVLAEVAAASPAEGLGDPDQLFDEAIAALLEVHHPLELARAYRAFAAHRERVGAHGEAVRLRMQADEIFSRLRGAAAARVS